MRVSQGGSLKPFILLAATYLLHAALVVFVYGSTSHCAAVSSELSRLLEMEQITWFDNLVKEGAAALPKLDCIVRDKWPQRRAYAVGTLAEMGEVARPLAPALEVALNEASNSIYCPAAEALGKLRYNPERNIPIIVRLHANEDELERNPFAGALFNANAPPPLFFSRRDLERWSGPRIPPCAHVLKDALASYGEEGAAIIQRLATRGSVDERRGASALLSGSNTAVTVISQLQDERKDVRANALRALEKKPPTDAAIVEALVGMLESGQGDVVPVLRKVGDPAIPALLKLLKTGDQNAILEASHIIVSPEFDLSMHTDELLDVLVSREGETGNSLAFTLERLKLSVTPEQIAKFHELLRSNPKIAEGVLRLVYFPPASGSNSEASFRALILGALETLSANEDLEQWQGRGIGLSSNRYLIELCKRVFEKRPPLLTEDRELMIRMERINSLYIVCAGARSALIADLQKLSTEAASPELKAEAQSVLEEFTVINKIRFNQ